jgi:hypothetical protein
MGICYVLSINAAIFITCPTPYSVLFVFDTTLPTSEMLRTLSVLEFATKVLFVVTAYIPLQNQSCNIDSIEIWRSMLHNSINIHTNKSGTRRVSRISVGLEDDVSYYLHNIVRSTYRVICKTMYGLNCINTSLILVRINTLVFLILS